MDRHQPAKVRRRVELKRVAIERCCSEEASQVLKNEFERVRETCQSAGEKAALSARRHYVRWQDKLRYEWQP